MDSPYKSPSLLRTFSLLAFVPTLPSSHNCSTVRSLQLLRMAMMGVQLKTTMVPVAATLSSAAMMAVRMTITEMSQQM